MHLSAEGSGALRGEYWNRRVAFAWRVLSGGESERAIRCLAKGIRLAYRPDAGVNSRLMSTARAYEEIVDFIAAGASPQNVVAFRPSEIAKRRVMDLIDREKTASLSPEERSELDHYLQLEHLMRLAKARARRYVLDE